ncbi:hypothetical protein CRYUN_Cryun26dG0136500 [Craigia yunnanensis]
MTLPMLVMVTLENVHILKPPIICQGKRPNVAIAMQSAPNSISENSKRTDLWERLLVSSALSAHSGGSSGDIYSEAISKSRSPRRKFLKESLEALDKLDDIDEAVYAKVVEKFHDAYL